jgi:hypothetical protein
VDKVTLPIRLLDGIMGYLSRQPYDQVYQLIAEVQKEALSQVAANNPPPPNE